MKKNPSTIDSNPEKFQDQGFHRPKILIIVPFRSTCFKLVKFLIDEILPEPFSKEIMNKKRFFNEFETPKTQKIHPNRSSMSFRRHFARVKLRIAVVDRGIHRNIHRKHR